MSFYFLLSLGVVLRGGALFSRASQDKKVAGLEKARGGASSGLAQRAPSAATQRTDELCRHHLDLNLPTLHPQQWLLVSQGARSVSARSLMPF
jgi:hypothetical protein